MGLAMLDRYDETLAQRRETTAELQRAVVGHPLSYQAGSQGSTWQGFHVAFPSARARTRAVMYARQELIEVRKSFDPPLHRHAAFAAAPRGSELTVTDQVAARSLTLPMANQLGRRQITRIARLIDMVFS